MLRTRLTRRTEPGRQGRGHPEAGEDRQRRGDEHGEEVGEQLQPVVHDPPGFQGPVQGQVLDAHRHCVREHLPAGRDQAPPLPGREQQHVEDDAVGQPQGVHPEVPPPGQPDGMADPGQPDLPGQADGILLRRPQRISGNRFLDPEPVPARGAVPGPVQPGMIGEDLHSRPDDEHQQEQIQEVLHIHPPRQPGLGLGRGSRGDAGVGGDEPLHGSGGPQPLRGGDPHDQEHEPDRQQPAEVEPPVPPDPHPRGDPVRHGHRPRPGGRVHHLLPHRQLRPETPPHLGGNTPTLQSRGRHRPG